jgi:hypothetical protein
MKRRSVKDLIQLKEKQVAREIQEKNSVKKKHKGRRLKNNNSGNANGNNNNNSSSANNSNSISVSKKSEPRSASIIAIVGNSLSIQKLITRYNFPVQPSPSSPVTDVKSGNIVFPSLPSGQEVKNINMPNVCIRIVGVIFFFCFRKLMKQK